MYYNGRDGGNHYHGNSQEDGPLPDYEIPGDDSPVEDYDEDYDDTRLQPSQSDHRLSNENYNDHRDNRVIHSGRYDNDSSGRHGRFRSDSAQSRDHEDYYNDLRLNKYAKEPDISYENNHINNKYNNLILKDKYKENRHASENESRHYGNTDADDGGYDNQGFEPDYEKEQPLYTPKMSRVARALSVRHRKSLRRRGRMSSRRRGEENLPNIADGMKTLIQRQKSRRVQRRPLSQLGNNSTEIQDIEHESSDGIYEDLGLPSNKHTRKTKNLKDRLVTLQRDREVNAHDMATLLRLADFK